MDFDEHWDEDPDAIMKSQTKHDWMSEPRFKKIFNEIARKPNDIGISPYGKDIVVKPSTIEIRPNGTKPLGKSGIVRCLVLLTAANESRKPLPSLLSRVNSRSERIAQNAPFTPTRERLPSSSVSPSPVGLLSPAEYIQLWQTSSYGIK